MIDFLALNDKHSKTVEFVQLNRIERIRFDKDNIIIVLPNKILYREINDEEARKLIEYLAPLSLAIEVKEIER